MSVKQRQGANSEVDNDTISLPTVTFTCIRVAGQERMTKKRSEMARLSRKALESLRKAAVLTIAVIIRRGPMEAT